MGMKHSLFQGTALTGLMRKRQARSTIGTRDDPNPIKDIPLKELTAREKYLAEAPEGKLREGVRRLFEDHPRFEPAGFSHKNTRNWSVKIPGVIQTEAGELKVRLEVESHVIGYDPVDQTNAKARPEPIFRDRAEVVVTGVRKSKHRAETPYDRAIRKFLQTQPDAEQLWHRTLEVQELREPAVRSWPVRLGGQ